MAADASLILRPWTDADVRAMVPSVEANPWGALESVRDVLAGSHLFEYTGAGRHALIAARAVDCTHGRRVDITGLVSTGQRLSALDIQSMTHGVAARLNADLLAMTTLRPHLARTCTRAGWLVTGQLLTINTKAMQ